MLKKLSAKIARILGTPAGRRRKLRTLVQVVPAIESLEERLLLSGASIGPSPSQLDVQYNAGTVTITATNANDVVQIEYHAAHGHYTVRDTNGVMTHIAANDPNAPVHFFVFKGLDGHDRFVNNTDVSTKAFGGAGNDTMSGGYGFDQLFGEAGNDQLFAFGDAWVDELYGGADDDYMLGSHGSDNMYGGAGSDTLIGGGGDDVLYGESGADFLYGGMDNDELDGGDDGLADYLNGGLGADKFQMEGYGNPDSLFSYYYNLDHPSDYNPAEGDSFFGADTPEATTDTGGWDFGFRGQIRYTGTYQFATLR
ncbi:MAG: calcium-binding protein [Planctomycetaceae bacterium]